VVFALGGPYGHGAALRQAAWRTVRLSDLVLNHEVARVVLYEQLYRAMMQLAGAPYHH
jgi:23S rRNA (pseudouridine1915-N3)-methyltransferase